MLVGNGEPLHAADHVKQHPRVSEPSAPVEARAHAVLPAEPVKRLDLSQIFTDDHRRNPTAPTTQDGSGPTRIQPTSEPSPAANDTPRAATSGPEPSAASAAIAVRMSSIVGAAGGKRHVASHNPAWRFTAPGGAACMIPRRGAAA
jgi:hypothetical protein